MDAIFIKGNVPSSKNSKINGRFFSKTVQNYLKYYGIATFSSSKKQVVHRKVKPNEFPIEQLMNLFKDREFPITIGFHFVRNSKHKFDFGNVCQILLDLFTAYDIIPDDNMDYVVPQCTWIEKKAYSYDKSFPGVYISIVEMK